MASLDLVVKFLDCFCRGDIDHLAEILADDLEFEGPLLQVNGRENYLEALRSDPPEQSTYQILDFVEEAEKVVVFYEYRKPQGNIKVEQSFVIKNGYIAKMVLVFDCSQLD